MIAKVTIVCDSPRHARGKEAIVAVYRRFQEGWEREYSPRSLKKADERRSKLLSQAPVRGDIHDWEAALTGDPRSGPAQCNLCGDTVRLTNLKLQMCLETLANQGVSRIGITQLHALS